MEVRMKVAGHPVHQMLIAFPVGLLSTAVVFDAIHLIAGSATASIVAYWVIAAGVLGGLGAAIFGVVDWLGIPHGTRAYRLGLLHGIGNACVVVLFAASWLLRRPDPGHPSIVALLLMLVGAGLSVVTSWLGGELVDLLGVGIDDGAHLNAPSSLSNRTARSG